MSSLRKLATRILALDEKIRPIANRPVDITKPGWAANLATRTDPLDEAGVRTEAEQVLADALSEYASVEAADRAFLRQLFAKSPSFAWAATLPFAADTPENFRLHLLLFSVQDQGRDSRDALLSLQALCRSAKLAGVSMQALRETAALSSEVNKYGMGSTKDMLLRAAQDWKQTAPA
jgi:hypothetical protein